MSVTYANPRELHAAFKVGSHEGFRKLLFRKTKHKVWVQQTRVQDSYIRVDFHLTMVMTKHDDGNVYTGDFTVDGVPFESLPRELSEVLAVENFVIDISNRQLLLWSERHDQYMPVTHEQWRTWHYAYDLQTIDENNKKIWLVHTGRQRQAGFYHLTIGGFGNPAAKQLNFPFTRSELDAAIDEVTNYNGIPF